MKKTFLSLGIIGLSTLALAGCGNQQKKETKTDATPKTEHKVKKEKSAVTSSSDETSKASSEAESSVSSASSTTQANDPNVTPQQLGTMVGFLQSPDWFKEYLKDGTMYYGTNNPKQVVGRDEVAGYDFISANGAPESYIYYKKNGDTVTIKWVDTPMDSQMKSRTISYHNLLQDYYQNQDQKNEVNSDASQLKDWASANQSAEQN